MSREKGERYTYRWKLNNAYRIGETESWLTDMAAEGRHLEKAGAFRFRFREGEPRAVRYRVDLKFSGSGMTEEEQCGAYEEYGWEYVTRFGEFLVFRSPEEEDAAEIHTDPAEQALTLRRLEKRLTGLAAFTVVSSILIIAMLCAVWFIGATPILNLVNGQSLQQIFLAAFYIYLLGNSVWEAYNIRKLCAALREGRPVDHRAEWRKGRRRSKCVFLVVLLLEIPVLALPVAQLAQTADPEFHPLPTDSGGLPFVRLAEIEQDPRLAESSDLSETQRLYENHYTDVWTVLASSVCEMEERGEVPGELWPDWSGVYSPSVTSKTYQLRMEGLAEPLARELIGRYNNLENVRREGGTVEVVKDSRFDFLMVARSEYRTELAAVSGKTVIWLRYMGFAEPETVVDAVAEKL